MKWVKKTVFLCIVLALTTNLHAQTYEQMVSTKKEALDHFNDDKFGMFIHWGIYSILGGVYKGEKIDDMKSPDPKDGAWIQATGEIPRAEYDQLVKQFNPILFDADEYVQLIKNAGMKYLVITAKHHDGFALWDSKVSTFDMGSTPSKRDLLQELYDACQKYGVDFGLYYSHNIDWHDAYDCNIKQYLDFKGEVWPEPADFTGKKRRTMGANLWDPSPNTFDDYLYKKAYPQVEELLTKFPNLKIIWYDFAHFLTADQSFKFYQMVYKLNPNVIVTDRVGNNFGDFRIPGDNKIPSIKEMGGKPWETVGTFNNSWGYKSYDNDWKSPYELIYWITAISSRGGNYMLNIGPKGDGTIPEQNVKILHAIGEWMSVNGTAIYGTKRWKVSREGTAAKKMLGTGHRETHGFTQKFTTSDFWFTAKGNKVYVIALERGKEALIKSFAEENIQQVKLLGHHKKFRWKQTEEGLSIVLPKNKNKQIGYALEVTLTQDAKQKELK
ncbi:alpha-L-fucosidase [Flammeovirga agarivorans]|uniref:alpha-L-fucosidase n=1 Tax=Flammeovirga agarivorans TaxID=2726742 RepID=A0A7X8XXN2_9BACT|nr:alpha-L-fucosidase [Flammeovirga agarivorans]NLR93318.1 alpha-L-fucosidase [Flammeovirga agarivorans]